MTARAVAERAGANPGLIHYHFGSLDGLRHAASAHAVDVVLGGATDRLLAAEGADEVVGVLDDLVGELAGGPGARLPVELLAAAVRDPQVRSQVAGALRRVREQLAAQLAAADPAAAGSAGATAVVVVAALDGLLLHRILDPDLDLTAAAAQLAPLVTGDGKLP